MPIKLVEVAAMERKIILSTRCWALTEQITDNLEILLEKCEKMTRESCDTGNPGLNLTSPAPVILLDKNLSELTDHIQTYIQTSIPMIFTLRRIGRNMTNGDLLTERATITAELNRATSTVITDIRSKQALLGNYLDPAKTFNLTFILDNAEIFEEIRKACTGFNQALAMINKLIIAFTKDINTNPAVRMNQTEGDQAKRERKGKILRKANSFIQAQLEKHSPVHQVSS